MRKNYSPLSILICSFATLLITVCAQAQPIFEDDFNGPLDFNQKWTYVAPSGVGSNGNGTGTVGNSTQFSNAPYVTFRWN